MPIPDSGTPAAIGFAKRSGIPYEEGLIKNRYVGRTFIEPDQELRRQGIRLKFNPLDEIAGKRIVIVDDSIVRGNTMRAARRDALRGRRRRGARPDLVAAGRLAVLLRDRHGRRGASSRPRTARSRRCASTSARRALHYLSLEGMQWATRLPRTRVCRACFTRDYPTRVPDGAEPREAALRAGRRVAHAGAPLPDRQAAPALLRGGRHRCRTEFHGRAGRAAAVRLALVPTLSRRTPPQGSRSRPPTRSSSGCAPPSSRPRTPGVVGAFGAFAGLFALDERRLLAASTDSVGSKLVLGRRAGRLRWCGADLAAHCINDVLTTGAEPLFFLDYVAANTIDVEQVAELVEGAAEVCRAAGCAILGGETAELPGIYREDEIDFCGTVVGLVDRDELIDGSRVEPGDVVVGLPSAGIHANGFSLVRAHRRRRAVRRRAAPAADALLSRRRARAARPRRRPRARPRHGRRDRRQPRARAARRASARSSTRRPGSARRCSPGSPTQGVSEDELRRRLQPRDRLLRRRPGRRRRR